jgi:hypothetical protein
MHIYVAMQMRQRRKLETGKERLSHHLSFVVVLLILRITNLLLFNSFIHSFVHLIFANDLVNEASSICMITFAPGSIEHLSIVLNFISINNDQF